MSVPAIAPDERKSRLETPVRDVMRPGAISMPADASLLEAKRAMIRHGVHAVLIVDGGGAPRGWVTDDGLLRWLGKDLSTLPAGEGVTQPVYAIDPDASIAEAIEALAVPRPGHLVVASDLERPPLGVISTIDVVDHMTRA